MAFFLDAFLKAGTDTATVVSLVTGVVTSAEGSDPITTDDNVSVQLQVTLFPDEKSGDTTETQLEFYRNMEALAPGAAWEHVWTIQGAVHFGSLTVFDDAGLQLASASFTLP